MSMKRITAVIGIFLVACAGWCVLGTTTRMRSKNYSHRLGSKVQRLWGIELVQEAPSLAVEDPRTGQIRWLMPAANDIKVRIDADHRKKGLIWYPTYRCSFNGVYKIENTSDASQDIVLHFDFPTKDTKATYSDFALSLDGKPVDIPVDITHGIDKTIQVGPGKAVAFGIGYSTRGIRAWRYRTDHNVGRVRNLALQIDTDFADVDYTEGSLSPMDAVESDEGMKLTWRASDLITGEDIGIIIPEKLNPGPLTSRITFFAPVCLLFFFLLIATINIIYKVNIHPMHYMFVAAGFFAFHLLLAYMVGIINIHISFIISAVTSVVLVTSYLSGALAGKFPWKIAAAGQMFFLVLFSYTFFMKGTTGLTVAVGSVVTLAVLMRVTANIDWNEVFASKARPPRLSRAGVETAKEGSVI